MKATKKELKMDEKIDKAMSKTQLKADIKSDKKMLASKEPMMSISRRIPPRPNKGK